VPSIASGTLLPTAAEVTAGTDLSHFAEINGFTVKGSNVQTPDMATEFTGTIPGETTADDSSITFYEDDTDHDIEDVLERGVEGFIAIYRKGYATGKIVDVFPVRVSSRYPMVTAANEPAKFQVDMSITDTPAQDLTMGTVS
jgi:hypothetical protein